MAEETETTETTQETTQHTEDKKDTTEKAPEKTFTQAELDKVIADRLARERAKMPAADKLKAFEEWQKAQQSEAEKAAEREKEVARLQGEAENLKCENAVIKAGVNADDVDYVLFKVGRMEGEFEKNLKAYLEENKKYTEPKTTQVQGTQHGPSKAGDDSILTARDRAAMGLPPKKGE
ncbi:MAG: hypothetical protein AB2L21_00525 [Anaerolineaceae bacterium]